MQRPISSLYNRNTGDKRTLKPSPIFISYRLNILTELTPQFTLRDAHNDHVYINVTMSAAHLVHKRIGFWSVSYFTEINSSKTDYEMMNSYI